MTDASVALAQQIEDFRLEAIALDRVLAHVPPDTWQRATSFKAWTIWDVVAHLHMGDTMGFLTLTDPQEFERQTHSRHNSPMSRVAFTREWIGDLDGPSLLVRWREGYQQLIDRFASADPNVRLKWSGPGMKPRMFMTSRQMETWAHGSEIFDLLGVTQEPTARLYNIATLGVRTYGWTFSNRNLTPPGPPPRVQLTAPDATQWVWNGDNAESSVHGNALDFCQVVTQVRNVADVNIQTYGDAASTWMKLAQCFAGPPEDPPVPGSRVPR